jgi:hypothetical protein
MTCELTFIHAVKLCTMPNIIIIHATHPELEQHFSGPELPIETNYTAIHMKQSSERPYIHPNPIIGAFFTTDSEKRDIKKKVLWTDGRTVGNTWSLLKLLFAA